LNDEETISGGPGGGLGFFEGHWLMINNLAKLWSAFVRCLVVLTAFQTALPCVHAHPTGDHVCPGWSACNHERISSIGSKDAHAGSTAWRWHVHFGVPDSDGHSSDVPGPCEHTIIAADVLADADTVIRDRLLMVSHPVGAFEPVLPSQCPASQLDAARTVSSFFATFATEMSFPVRFGNVRC
jgi:hypothetical protein